MTLSMAHFWFAQSIWQNTWEKLKIFLTLLWNKNCNFFVIKFAAKTFILHLWKSFILLNYRATKKFSVYYSFNNFEKCTKFILGWIQKKGLFDVEILLINNNYKRSIQKYEALVFNVCLANAIQRYLVC